MPTILLTGATGQVGRELQHGWGPEVDLVAADRSVLDLTDGASIRRVLDEIRPDVVINAAAYTAVDRAEDEPDAAHAVNAQAVAHLAEGAERHGYRLIHFSTDYVFDGSKPGWYDEADEPCPLGVYGRSKVAGEQAVLSSAAGLVLRTSWVYSRWGSNFVKTMLRLADQHPAIRVVDDQHGCPTSAADIADAVRTIVRDHRDACGLYHLASPAAATWYELATAALAPAVERGTVTVEPISTDGYPTRARRPANSRLSSAALRRDFDIELPHWRASLPSVLDPLLDSPQR